MNRLSLLLRRGEKKLERKKEGVEKEKARVEKEKEEKEKKEKETIKERKPCCVEVLKGEERSEALEGDPISKEGLLTVILRSSEDDSKREAVRLPRVSVRGGCEV